MRGLKIMLYDPICYMILFRRPIQNPKEETSNVGKMEGEISSLYQGSICG